MSDDVRLETQGLDQLIKSLKGSLAKARVGILGSSSIRNEKAVNGQRAVNAAKARPKTKFNAENNASLGAIHEFGVPGRMPQRSFLRVPIAEHLQSKMEDAGAFDKDQLALVLKEGSVTPWVKRIAILAVGIVHEAFDTGGFGKWPAWKNPNYKNDHNRLLEDTGQLRDSITSDVK